MTNDTKVKEALHEFFIGIGQRGGRATVEKHGKLKMAEWGKLGGRPRHKAKKPLKQAKRNKRKVLDKPTV